MFFQSPSDLFRTDEFLDKTSQLPEEALIMTIDNKDANDQCFMFTSAKVKKFQDGDRLMRFTQPLLCNQDVFFKIVTIVYQKDSCFFQPWVQQEVKRSSLQDYEGTHTHTHTNRLL